MTEAEEIERKKCKEWREADSYLAELGMIAEELGMDVSDPPWKPRFETGAVLAAVREAVKK